MDNLWARRSNSSKLSLSTNNPSANGAPATNDHPARSSYTLGRRHDSSASFSTRTSFSAMSPSTSLTSPTAGASSAFGLGSGAFASFGSAKNPKTPGTNNALDFSSVVGGASKTPTTEKQFKDLGVKQPSKASVPEPKSDSVPANHSLRHSWVFWFRPPQSKSNGYVEYDKSIHAMATIGTVEDFFTIYRHLKRPSTLPLVSDYHIFKKGTRPIWEDQDNKKGGKWIVRLKKGVADRYWEDLVLALLGDQFAEASDEVCGAVLSVRNGEDILSIWARNDGGRVLRIRETMKRILTFPPDTKVEWKSHDDSIQQRTAIDDARKEKGNSQQQQQHHQHQHNYHSNRNASREIPTSVSDEK